METFQDVFFQKRFSEKTKMRNSNRSQMAAKGRQSAGWEAGMVSLPSHRPCQRDLASGGFAIGVCGG